MSITVVAVIAMSACTTGTPVPTGTAAPVLEVASIDEDALDATLESLSKELLLPGSVLLLRTPEGEFTATYGVTELGGTVPVSLDQHIRVGSNTKTMTGTIILQLVDEGLISLEDPVSAYRADVPNGENITIEQLLTMRSGLFNYTETYELNAALDATPQRAWDPEELIAMGLALPVYFEPGEGYHYSNTNTVLLGRIAEQLTGQPLAELMSQRLFEPLGMTNTLFPEATDSTLPEPYPHGYMYTDNVFTLASSKLPADLLLQAQEGTLLPGDQTFSNPSWGWAAGAGISTASDLATWVEALTEGGLLDEATQSLRMQSPQPTTDDPASTVGYGLALAKFGELYGHTGELPGFNSFMGHDPVNDITLIVWANLAPTAQGVDPATEIAKAVIGQLYVPASHE
ncbi:MAG: serine hydrolase domain-containing protein [Rhodoglobus sp.]